MPHELHQRGSARIHSGTPTQAYQAAEDLCRRTRRSVAVRLHGDNGCKKAYAWIEPDTVRCVSVLMPMRPTDILDAAERNMMTIVHHQPGAARRLLLRLFAFR